MVNHRKTNKNRSVTKLLKELRQVGVHLWVERGKLRSKAPKGAITPALRRRVGLHKEALISFLQQAEQSDQALQIVPAPRTSKIPLSFAQQRLFFLDQMGSGSAYYMPMNLNLRGPLNVAVLQQTLQEIVRRHESLRTTFEVDEGVPHQVIHADITIDLPVIDLSAFPAQAQKGEVLRLTTAELARPFDLSGDPMLRATLLRLSTPTSPRLRGGADAEHILLLTMHHIASDGWSMGLLIREMAALYEAFSQGQPSPLPTLPIQYADFAIWQRSYLQGDVLKKQLRYWTEQLADAPELLQLPTDHARPASSSGEGAMLSLQLDAHLTRQLQTLTQQQGSTRYMTLLAAFQVLMARYSGQTDIVVGSPIANRNRQEIEPLIGFFTNTLALRVDLSAHQSGTDSGALQSPSFLRVLAQVKKTVQAAHDHQDIPFERLVEELQLTRSLSHNPLVQVMFALQTVPIGAFELSGLTVTPAELGVETTQFDLEMHFWPVDDYLQGYCIYSTDLFDEATIARMANHFKVLLNSIVSQPDMPVMQLPMLTDAEYHQIVHEFNRTAVDFGHPQTTHALFEQQVARTPDAIALVFGDTQLTYHELNTRANQLAHHLISLGVQAETLVAVAMERSIEMVVSLLAVHKAGGAYVPIDPSYPEERIHYMLTDSAAPILLTQSHLFGTLRVRASLEFSVDSKHVIAVDRAEAIYEQPTHNPQSGTTIHNLAYVIYTSGSTGKPKGVMIQHDQLYNLLRWHQREFEVTSQDRASQMANPAFDATVWELFPYLTAGATVFFTPEDERLSPSALIKWFAEHAITIGFVPTPMVNVMMETGSDLSEPAPWVLKWLLTGGDKLTHYPPSDATFRLVNNYGPTENTVVATSGIINPSASSGHRSHAMATAPHIGKPIDNVEIYILSDALQPVPINIPGELYVGGTQLARGYLNRPELTAERFIEHPKFGRLYKTGDLCRWLSDGSIDFMGRTDFQVKIRGFRIELGEIESALLAQDGVREVVVLAREDLAVQGDKRLVAYVVGHADSGTLRQQLAQRLPDYMVPSAFVKLDAMPLTPNGKLDRRALPAPDIVQLGGPERVEGPRTPTEERLVTIWQEVLGQKLVSIHHNFFEVGGHSLLALQIMARIRAEFNIELPVRIIFEAPTIAALGKILERSTASPLSSIQKLARQPDYTDMPLSFAQQRLWFLNRMENSGTAYNVLSAFHLTGALQVAALQQALAKIITRHEVFRTTFPTIEGTPVQRIHAAPYDREQSKPLIQVDLRALDQAPQHNKLMHLLGQEANYAFDFEQGPLLRVSLYHLQPNQSVLMLNMHHIISDDWSVGVWWRELNALYQAFASGKVSPLPDLPLQYADFAQWQREHLTGELLDQQLVYWKKQLADAPSLLDLPTDRPRPATQTFNGAWQKFELEADLATALFQRCHDLDVTPFIFLQTTFAILLARYSGQEDVMIGSPISNRKQIEIEPLIGFFVNTLVLRTDLSGNPSFEELLKRMRQTVLDAFSQADIPFEQLVSELNVQRNINHSPLFQVLFVWQQAETTPAALGDLTVTPLALEHRSAKFDLTLYLSEHPDEASEGMGIIGAFEYNTDLFDHATIERMIGHLQTLLTAIIANPTQSIWQLPLLSARKQTQLLKQWNDTQSSPVNQCLHHLFEAQAERTPDAVAVEFPATLQRPASALTYRELNERANQLARYLQTLGVGPDAIVGICLERSIEMTTGILAILKAGGAYLPIDPTYPAERIAFMLTDAKVSWLLTLRHAQGTAQETLRAELPETGSQLICLESIQPMVAQQSTENLHVEMSEENLLYLLYTSGSTGQPKGVMMPHRPLTNLIQWQLTENLFHTAKHKPTRTLQFTPISFDVSCQELFTTWAEGGTLVLVEESRRRDPIALLRYLADQKIDRLFLPFVALQQLAEAAMIKGADLAFALRDVITAGEQLQTTTAIKSWFQRMNATLHNQYGPTETHVITAYTLPENVDSWSLLPPIGRPIANCQTYILDKHQQPVPIGVAGELYLGGIGVARGYLNRPALTEERFTRLRWTSAPNLWPPTTARASGLLYRPGDLARYRADGQIEYLGRIDNQVKVRGYRIEPGEIEAVLAQHVAVREAVVMAPQDQTGQRRLVAVAALHQKHRPADTQAQLHHYLRQKLPAYMVPSRLLCVDKLPLTPSGKIDRRKLLDMPQAQPTLNKNFVSPQTKLEKQIANIWRELLELERVGVHDNFFDLGGHSLLVVQLFDRIQKITDANLSITQLFQYTTIASLANHLSQSQPTTQTYEKNKARAKGRRAALRRRRRK